MWGTPPYLEIPNTFAVGPNVFRAGAKGNVVLVVEVAEMQSANAQEWRDNFGTVLASVTPIGGVVLAFGSFALSNDYLAVLWRDGQFAWVNSSAVTADSVPDTGFARDSAALVRVTNGSTGYGRISMGLLVAPFVSPDAIVAHQNNYAPPAARNYRLTTDGSGPKNLTGLAVGQLDGQEVHVWNVGVDDIVLKHQDMGSKAANRFLCSTASDIAVTPNNAVWLHYDGTAKRWRVTA